MRIGLAADHAGFELKEEILVALLQADFEVVDCGAFRFCANDDFPDFVLPLAKSISEGETDRGIAICGSGIGASIAANKISNVRAGLIHDVFSARQGVEDDDMNIICLGALLVTFPFAWELIQSFLAAHFSSEVRFQRRLKKIAQTEKSDIRLFAP